VRPLSTRRASYAGHLVLARLTLPLAAGIALADRGYGLCAAHPEMLWAALLVSLAACFGSLCRTRPVLSRLPFTLFFSTGTAAVGALLLLAARKDVETAWPDAPFAGRAVLVGEAKEGPRSWTVDACLTDGPARGTVVRFTLAKFSDGTIRKPEQGFPKEKIRKRFFPDAFLFYATVRPPRRRGNPAEFDYAAYLRRNGIGGTAYCPADAWRACDAASTERMTNELPWTRRCTARARQLRRKLLERFDGYFEGRTLAVLSALTLGDKSRLDRETRELFAGTGTAHILALSGLHLGILFGLMRLLLAACRRQTARWVLATAGVALLWAFAVLAGLPLSLVRAAVMFSVMQAAEATRRHPFSLHALLLAAAVMLVAAPQALFDVGFQLSFTSVFFICTLFPLLPQPPWLNGHRVLRGLYGMAGVSLCAQIGTAPLVAYYFHTFPLYGPVANLLAGTAVGPLLAGGLLFLLLPAALQPALASWLGMLFDGLTAGLSRMAEWPCAVVEWRPAGWAVAACYAVAPVLLLASRDLRRRIYLPAGLALLLAGGAATCLQADRALTPRIVFYHNRTCPAVHCIAARDRSYLWTPQSDSVDSGMAAIRRTFWEEESLHPVILRGPARYRELLLRGDVLSFGGIRIALPARRRTRAFPEKPLAVDYLFISRHSPGDLELFLRSYRPRLVVLDASLPDWRRRALLREAGQHGLDAYDVESRGALVVPLSR